MLFPFILSLFALLMLCCMDADDLLRATTIHKSQGCTLSSAELMLDNTFDHGQGRKEDCDFYYDDEYEYDDDEYEYENDDDEYEYDDDEYENDDDEYE